VPGDYIKITSGLGEATPRFVVIVPLIIQSRVMGVMELASFEVMESYKIDFLKKISENIASILLNKKINTETSQLLAEAKEKEQRLAAQEEELRQNAEEMQAVQEQMERQQRELEKEIQKLKKSQEIVSYQ
jgi:septal ring factor EnvC (AmiA/AmiB activator)